MTFVYAKCLSLERLELWDNLYYLASDMELPWLVGGDFNVVLHEDEKIGGLPIYPPEYDDFSFCTNSCGKFDQGYKGGPFTWWNGRPNAACIFKRLDRIFVNLPFQNILPTIEVEHLIRTGSDHVPLLMTGGKKAANFTRPFRFLNSWTKHETFMEVVKQNWHADFIGDPFLMFKHKLKKVKIALSQWIRQTFGDIFKQLAILEDIVMVKEMLFEEEPTIENRIILQRTQSELKKYLSLEEQYWKQKAGMTWFAEGDRNTSFFHNHVNGNRKKLQIKRIQNGTGNWLEDQYQIAIAAVEFFQNQYPTLEEVKATIFGLNGNSSSGPDGFTGLFYQECWEIICNDIHNMVLRKMGFAEHFITLIWNLLSNNWYLVLVNGQSSGFFKSTRGVKQGDPLSPTLFILSAEVLFRSLNRLFEDESFRRFGMPKWTEHLNHLAYVDDTIIFASAHQPSLTKIMTVLSSYEEISSQQINRAKSSYHMHANAANALIQKVEDITGFTRGQYPFMYLGCPIFYIRRKKDYYQDLIKKVKAKLHAWKGKLLSSRGKETLITSVL
ncbi:uncharacterized protein LOC142169628 [Nicotiana tabacum]|uniref:Uncharacterized protein LOC142169628 n=1 Tax=Nicotiana tabacum TaxID=4097 RepID=A0AC58SRL1_TOBAC